MKILIIFLLLLENANAQSSLLPDFSKLKDIFQTTPNSQIQKKQFNLMEPSRKKGQGRWSITCWLPNGEVNPMVNNLQAKELHTGFIDYNLYTLEDKIVKVPINNCVIIEN